MSLTAPQMVWVIIHIEEAASCVNVFINTGQKSKKKKVFKMM